MDALIVMRTRRALDDDYDPGRMLTGIEINSMLRSSRFFSKIMGLARKYDNPDAPERSSSELPGRCTWDRRASRMDVVDMLIMRREIRTDRIFDRISSVQFFPMPRQSLARSCREC